MRSFHEGLFSLLSVGDAEVVDGLIDFLLIEKNLAQLLSELDLDLGVLRGEGYNGSVLFCISLTEVHFTSPR